MSRQLRSLLIFMFFLPLAACGFEAPAPKRLPTPPMPAPPLSTLSVSLVVPASEIARILDAKTEDHLADIRDKPVKCAIGRCKLTLLATREGPIESRAEDNRLSLEVPFGMDADVRLPGFFSMLRATGTAEGLAEADTSAHIGRNWQLVTVSDTHVELTNSHLRLGPVKANLTDIINDNDGIFSRPLSKMLDRELDRSVHLRDQVARAWARAFVPIKVAKKPVAWLVLAPERLRVSGPTASNGVLGIDLGVDVRARVVTQDVPPAEAAKPLPPPSPMHGPANRFSFVVPATITYDAAARAALASLQRKPLKVAGLPLRFTRLDFLPSRDDVVILARVCVDQNWDPTGLLSSCGTGYLRGVPVYDAASESIRVTHVHYDVLTEDAILAAMRALAGPVLGQDLESRLTFSVSRDLAKLRVSVSEALERPQGRDVTIAGKIDSFAEPSLTWTQEGFVALFSASGTVRADIHL